MVDANTELEKLFMEYFEAASRGDLDHVVEMTHPDCTIRESESIPYGGTYSGKEAFREIFVDVGEVWDDFGFEPQLVTQVDDKNKLFVHYKIEGVVPETGESIEMDNVEIFTFEDGLIKDVNVFYKDTHKLYEAFNRPEAST